MGDRERPRCHCGSLLRIHCGSHACTWLRCDNPGCDVANVNLDTGLWQYRDGHVERIPG